MSDPTAGIRLALARIEEWERNRVKTPEMTALKERLLLDLATLQAGLREVAEDQFSDDCGEHFNCDGVHREGPW